MGRQQEGERWDSAATNMLVVGPVLYAVAAVSAGKYANVIHLIHATATAYVSAYEDAYKIFTKPTISTKWRELMKTEAGETGHLW